MRYTRGPRPGCTGKDAKDRNVKEADTKWEFKPSQEPYLWETKYLLAASIQIAVEVTFSNYLYSFGGTNYRQSKGGPIGSRLTMAVSQILMMMILT